MKTKAIFIFLTSFTAQPIGVNLVWHFVGISIDAAPTGLDPLLQLFSTKIPSLRDSRNQKPI